MTSDQKKILKFIREVDKLKSVYRVIHIEKGVRKESSAEHSFHAAIMAWVFATSYEKRLNLEKVIKMTLVHDLVEIYNGDIFFFDTKARINKHENEKKAAIKLFKLLPEEFRKEMFDLWMEFEELKTPEARFVKGIDQLHPMIQNILNDGITWRKLKVTSEMIYDHKIHLMDHSLFLLDFMKSLLKEIKSKKIAFQKA